MININKIQKEKYIQELLNFSIINIDKPSGITSFKCIETVAEIIGIKKIGHFGTLDPMVTGVLPVALNRACKLSNYFIKKDKEYIGKLYLHSEISIERLNEEIKKFTGKIIQKPPRRSSVKREFREKTVNNFEILKINGKIVEFKCEVEAGTYIRTMVHDLGKNIGGAHMFELRRIKAGIFLEKEIVTIEELEEAIKKFKEGDEKELRKILITGEIISQIIEVVNVKEENLNNLLNGKPITKEDKIKIKVNEDNFAVFLEDRFIGIYKKVDEENIIARPQFVFN